MTDNKNDKKALFCGLLFHNQRLQKKNVNRLVLIDYSFQYSYKNVVIFAICKKKFNVKKFYMAVLNIRYKGGKILPRRHLSTLNMFEGLSRLIVVCTFGYMQVYIFPVRVNTSTYSTSTRWNNF